MGIFGIGKRRKRARGNGRSEPQLFAEHRKPPQRSEARRRPWTFRLLAWGVMLCLWGLIALAGLTAYVWFSLDQQGLFKIPERPDYVPQGVIAIEGPRLYSHFGIDPIGLRRPAFSNFRAGHIVQGGST